jgi:hypothetical protein
MNAKSHPEDIPETDDVPKVDTTSKNMHSDSTPALKESPAKVRPQNGDVDGQTRSSKGYSPGMIAGFHAEPDSLNP